ncbi:hypothetical protein [Flavobacterium daemonense]|uniref:hypothetical protein n=1 Tax=Flavobacterium daemonense TaxID=1393049 RepID=UPI001184E36D|nr:hypothetical protein [Flavobacterium daemonense]KAF2330169.1 hypothetical protein FND99_15005 [Flavobacterium daemonense]
MKKLNIRVLLLQFFGMIFLINGILQLRFYTVAEKIICAKNHFEDQKSSQWNRLFPNKEEVLSFWPSVYIWIFFGLVMGIFIVVYLNWKSKLSPLNSIFIAVLLYILLRFKFFRREIASQFFRPVRTAFSDDFAVQCLFEGIIFTIIGLTILYVSVNPDLFTFRKTAIPS